MGIPLHTLYYGSKTVTCLRRQAHGETWKPTLWLFCGLLEFAVSCIYNKYTNYIVYGEIKTSRKTQSRKSIGFQNCVRVILTLIFLLSRFNFFYFICCTIYSSIYQSTGGIIHRSLIILIITAIWSEFCLISSVLFIYERTIKTYLTKLARSLFNLLCYLFKLSWSSLVQIL